MGNLILALIILFTSGATHKQDLSTFYTSETAITVEQIQDSQFTPNPFVNSFNKKGTCWIQLELSDDIPSEEKQVLFFNREPFFLAEIFLQTKNGNWISLGKTGNGISLSEKVLSSIMNGCPVPPEYQDCSNLKIRIKIDSVHNSLVQVFTTSRSVFIRLNSIIFSLLIMFTTIGFTLAFSILIYSICFKEYQAIPIILMIFFLIFDLLIVSGCSKSLFAVDSGELSSFYKIRYFTLCGPFICIHYVFTKLNRDYIKNNQTWTRLNGSIFPISYILVFAIGLFYMVTNISTVNENIFKFLGLFISYILFFTSAIFITKVTPSSKHPFILLIMIALTMSVLEELFLELRFYAPLGRKPFFINKNYGIVDFIILCITEALLLIYLVFSAKKRFERISLQADAVKEQHIEYEKRTILYTNIYSIISNPMQILLSEIEKIHDENNPLYMEINSQINEIYNLFKTMQQISENDFNLSSFEESFRPVELHKLIYTSILPELQNLKTMGCYPDLQENFLASTCVSTNKEVLSHIFKSLLQLAVNNTEPNSTVKIISNYSNFMFNFSVTFKSQPITASESYTLLSLSKTTSEDTPVSQILQEPCIKKWGLTPFMLNSATILFNGNLEITSSSEENTFSITIGLSPMPYNIDSTGDDFYESPIDEVSFYKNENNPDQIVYIIEENVSIRKALSDRFSRYYSVQTFSSSNDFFNKMKTSNPVAIIASSTISGLNILEVLNENISAYNTIPIFIMTKNASQKNILKLFEAGISDIFEKPFNVDYVFFRVKSTVTKQMSFSEAILKKLSNSLKSNFNEFNFTTPREAVSLPEKTEILPPENSSSKEDITQSSMNAIFTSAGLTKKEIDIATQIYQGKSDKEIAIDLDIAPSTVAVHNKKIYKKLGVHSRKELIEKIQ